MLLKLVILAMLCLLLNVNTEAQKVIRKGTTPITVNKKPGTKSLYSLDQLTGKWQETKRLAGKESVAFKDSLQLRFEKNSVEIRDAVNLNQNGTAQIEAPNTLQAAGDSYEIISLSKSVLVINDGEFIKHLEKIKTFYYETLGKIILPVEKLDSVVNIDINNLKGKWMVYRRQAEPSFVNDNLTLIKSLNITGINPDGNTATGKIVFYKTDITEGLPCMISYNNGTILISTENNKWNFYTYKADGKEFVFGKTGELVYYAKLLNQ